MLDSGWNEEITSSVSLMGGNVEVEEDDGHVKVVNLFGNVHINGWGITVPVLVENLIGLISPKKEILEKNLGSLDLDISDSGLNVENRLEGRLDESVVGFKRQMEAEYFDKEGDEKSEIMDRLNKKQKCHGGPPNMQGDSCFSRKILDDEEVCESTLLIGKEQTKQKCCRRPPKAKKNLEENDVEEVDENGLLIVKEKRGRGRPRKVHGEIGSNRKILNENDVEDVDKSGLLIVKEKRGRGRPRKRQRSSVKVKVENDGVTDSCRVLRSGFKMMRRSVKVDETVVGFKRQMEAEYVDTTELDKDVDEISQAMGRLNLIQGEIGSSGKEQKIQKRRGRPPKVRKLSDENDGEEVDKNGLQIVKEKRQRGRPLKIQGGVGSTSKSIDESDVEEVDESGLLIVNEQNKEKCGRGRPSKMQGATGLCRTIKSECSDDSDVEEVDESTFLSGTGNQQKKQNDVEKICDRRMKKRLVRDEIVSMIMKAGWTIEYRPRQSREHVDTVYVDRRGKAHWSARRAYFSLEKKIKKGVASKKEVASFTSIHNKKLSLLFNTKRKENEKGKNVCKAKIVTTRMAQQLVRDQVVSMILKAGWTIEYRQRRSREYMDAVYVDREGKAHWSITKAYFSLKMKIKKGVASEKEVAAFTSIPNKKLSLLFREKGKGKNGCKAEIIITGMAQLKRHKKKLEKERKEKKATQQSSSKR